MPKTLIEQNPTFTKKVEGPDKLAIAELFCDTLQGEGVTSGVISTFMRLQGCTLKCVWCDTLEVWPNGNEYTFEEIFALFEGVDLIERFRKGQHLILTGGSPLKQQDQLIKFLNGFMAKYGFLPYIEVENEAVLMPKPEFIELVNQWNNSPKLANSGMKPLVRIKPDVLRKLSNPHNNWRNNNSWFKFVISSPEDWDEIERDYLSYIPKHQIILMPEGQTQDELNKNREMVADLAIKHNVRFTDRLHITIWNKKVGV
jgi:organic radical activating enzyme